MNKDLIEIKITLTKIQSEQLTRDVVKEMIEAEINKHKLNFR